MKRDRWLWPALVLGTALITGNAAAQDKGKQPFLQVRFDEKMSATLELKNAGGRDVCFPEGTREALVRLSAAGRSGLISASELQKGERLLEHLHVGARWYCYNESATQSDWGNTTMALVSVRDASATRILRSPYVLFAPKFVAPELLTSTAIREALGNPVACGYYPPDVQPPDDEKKLGADADKILTGADKKHPCSIRMDGDEFQATLRPNDVSDGKIAVVFKKTEGTDKGSRVVVLDAVSCSYKYNGPLPVLVQGARRQRILIGSSQSRCLEPLKPKQGPQTILLSGEGASLQVTTASAEAQSGPDQDSVALDVSGIPTGAKIGVQDWKIRSGSDELGTIRIEIAPAVTVGSKLSVVYDDPALDALQGRDSAEGIAVVDPVTCGPTQITNTATLTWPEGLRGYTSSTPQKGGEAPGSPGGTTSREDKRTPEKPREERFWMIQRQDAADWTPVTSDMKHEPCPEKGQGDEAARAAGRGGGAERGAAEANERRIDEVSRLSFRVKEGASTPLRAVLRLYTTGPRADSHKNEKQPLRPTIAGMGVADPGKGGGTPGPTSSVQYSEPQILLEMEMRLASSARRESLPLPIAEAMQVVCYDGKPKEAISCKPDGCPEDTKFDVAGLGEQRAIQDGAFESGSCWLVLAEDRIGEEKRRRLYGPQSLRVTVHRDGAQDQVRLWPIDGIGERIEGCGSEDSSKDKRRPSRAVRCGQRFNLPAPTGDANADAPYIVTVEVAAQRTAFAVYRTGIDGNARDDERKVRPEQVFETRLRSRGPFGWRVFPIRTFVTVPVELSGLRFPAAPVDLRSTSDSEVVQVVTPRVGLLLTAEPWNYDRSKNPLSIPLRFQTGMHMFQLGEGRPGFSFLAGTSAALPVFEGAPSQLQSSINIGMFYEMDLREVGSDFDPGKQSHFLVSLNFNVLSLLGAK
jgi:hypothetical protein